MATTRWITRRCFMMCLFLSMNHSFRSVMQDADEVVFCTITTTLTWTYGGGWVQLEVYETERGAEVCVSSVREARRCFVAAGRSAGKGNKRRSKYLVNFPQPACLPIQGPRASSAANLGPLLAPPDMYMCQHFALFAPFRMWPGYTLYPPWAHEVCRQTPN